MVLKRTSFVDDHGQRIGPVGFEKIFPDRSCALRRLSTRATLEGEHNALCRPHSPHRYQRLRGPCETVRSHAPEVFQQRSLRVSIRSSHNKQPRNPNSQTSDDPGFIITASPAPYPFPVIKAGIRGVDPVVVCRWIDGDDVHMSSKQ